MSNQVSDSEFIEDMQTYRLDHEPDGWPAVQQWKIDRLLGIITQYREMFEGLRVEEECSNENEDINELIKRCPVESNAGCEMKQGKVMKQCSGKLYRPLTMEEIKELVKMWIDDGVSEFVGYTLSSGAEVVRVK